MNQSLRVLGGFGLDPTTDPTTIQVDGPSHTWEFVTAASGIVGALASAVIATVLAINLLHGGKHPAQR